jgi:N-formylglutamate amidohydrolase
MRYKEVQTEFEGHKIKVVVHTETGAETDEELQERAIEVCKKNINESVMRSMGWVNDEQ